ncbi:unnamed protein product [Clavelina lepadiformis]|uniref:ShKT domain-containing protein n=1 Tax=Clavelina lepadiformis TaxID=159417 RepID=A0ABP0GJR1_CLALP
MCGLTTSLTSSFIIVALFQIHSSSSQECPCLNDEVPSTWGFWIGPSSCVGQCDLAKKVRTRSCFLPIDPTPVRTTDCLITNLANCTNLASCEGEWSSWSTVSDCSNSCGSGTEKQLRTCYKKNVPGNLRNKYCLGGYGTEEQTRENICSRRQGCFSRPTTTTTTSTTTTTTTTTTKTSTQAAPTVAVSGTSTSIGEDVMKDMTTNMVSLPLRPGPNVRDPSHNHQQTGNGLDTTTLAAILGSVAIVCITLIIVAVAAIRKRRKRQENGVTGNSTSIPTMPTEQCSVANYETVRPELSHDNESSFSNIDLGSPYYNHTMHDTNLQVPPHSNDLYLEPVPSPRGSRHFPAPEDTIYFTIDDIKK